ncbi:N-acetylglucosaminidase [Mechercharimyces sp. CAU 1602]|uniref:N-acetylglucosaminidase n=1 Tax=Mechercharimyces sp. CAU 1602 TaxID=2973933 RepID=UPI00216216D3|nr:glucosaminidase domain-containing protein [Mechercharimyces sp. CAU 1602]MCS1351169.1 glucosaminidase domain-containing protein [Mechercharimyces sp. CAU 1602]
MGFKVGELLSGELRSFGFTSCDLTVEQASEIHKEYGTNGAIVWDDELGGFRSATLEEVIEKVSPSNTMSPSKIFQHILLSKQMDVSIEQLDQALIGKGSLEGTGFTFKAAADIYGVDPVYLIAHSLLETNHGASALANGTVKDYEGYYNVFGLAAYDGDASNLGAAFAKQKNWNNVKKAIIGGAKCISDWYTYSSHDQDTLYKMLYNPANPGVHQYATDIGWAEKQSNMIYRICRDNGMDELEVEIDYPVYK